MPGRSTCRLCVFPQEGLTQRSRQPRSCWSQALRDGAEAIGGAPYTDTDPNAHLDAHLRPRPGVRRRPRPPSRLRPRSVLVASRRCLPTDRAAQLRRPRRDRPCHKALGLADRSGFEGGDRALADAGVARHRAARDRPLPDGTRARSTTCRAALTPAHNCRRRHRLRVATNNVLNPFTPFGDASLLRMANLYANVCQVAAARLRNAST